MKITEVIYNQNDAYFWVEEGQASLGNINVAKNFIQKAAEAGADGIEFQLAIPEEFYVKSHPYIEHYRKIQFSENQILELISYSNKLNIDFIATVLSSSLVPFLANNGCRAFVINASDINNPGIIDPVIESKLPFFISLPLASEKEIDWVVKRCQIKGAKEFVLMQGQHTMASGDHGVDPKDSNMGFIKTLKEKYQVPVGYIDHSTNLYMPSIARATGANFVSKHMFLNINDKGPDWFVCITPDQMKVSIDHFKQINYSLLNINKTLAPGENMDKTIMRRSIVASKNISKGEVIQYNDIQFKRPGGGISPSDYEMVIGKKATCDITVDELILKDKIR